MNFECQPGIAGGAKESPAQMLFTHVVSDAPVPAVCQVLRPFQTELNKANGSKSVPKQVCDSSTCVSPGVRFSFSCPDKESDLWQTKKDLSAPGRQDLSKESDSHNTHLLSPGTVLLIGWWVGGFRDLRFLVFQVSLLMTVVFDSTFT